MASDPLDFGVAGKDVWSLVVALQLTFNLQEGPADPGAWVTLAGPFRMREGVEVRNLDPCQAPEGLGPVFGLRNRKVLRAVASAEGHLEVIFEGGATVLCDPLPFAEAWDVGVAKGGRWVCLPGGGVSKVKND